MNSTEPSELELKLVDAPDWQDYHLLDSGEGAKLERFGRYTFVRPEPQAMWKRGLGAAAWSNADAVFADTDEENGKWQFKRPLEERWTMRYRELRFWAQVTSFRHLGVFPEQASQWDWAAAQLRGANRPTRVLNLFGYTGLASLSAAAAGAQVTHVDASKKVLAWARDNQALSGLEGKPIRWITDDALKFVRREIRREVRYDGIIMDPPKFGRGPQGEVWKFFEAMPELLQECRGLLSDQPLFVILTSYAVKVSPVSLYYALGQALKNFGGATTAGELITREEGGGRALAMATYARWSVRGD